MHAIRWGGAGRDAAVLTGSSSQGEHVAEPVISLILCTTGREAETARCIDSIIRQDYPSLTVVFVDQSEDARMARHVERLRRHCPVRHVRTSRVGASAARNIGARLATGAIISFPDDDCWYPPGALRFAAGVLERTPSLDGVTGRTVATDGSPGIGRFTSQAAWVSRRNIWTTSIEFTIFLRRSVWAAVGEFDESIGTGAATPFQAGEGTEYLIRATDLGFRVWYDPDLVIGHPVTPPEAIPTRKAFSYGIGMGHVARVNRLPLQPTSALLVRPWLGLGLSLLRGRLLAARFHGWVGLGRWIGYLALGRYGEAIHKAPETARTTLPEIRTAAEYRRATIGSCD